MPPREKLARLRRLVPPLVGDALDNLRASWRAQALTLAGIVWGAASVVLLLSLGSGFNDFLDFGFGKTGDRWVAVDPEYTSTEADGRLPGRRIRFTVRDLDRVRAGVPSAGRAVAENQDIVPVVTPRRTRATVVSAAGPELFHIQNHAVGRGRYFDADDERRGRRVAVLGADLVEVFFGDLDPLGRTLQIGGEPFEVIGVLVRKGWQFMTNSDIHDRMIFVPLSAGLRALGDGETIETILVEPRRIQDEPVVRREVRAALWPLHNLPPEETRAVSFMSVPEISEPSRRIFFVLQLLLGVVGTVTLAMAGTGVANLMIAIAHERRAELAVRRTCGARRADLMLQLLVETAVVVLVGGTLGVAIGLSAVLLIQVAPLPPDFPPPRILPSVVSTTFLVLVAVGLAAGVAPARVAARVDPASALRVT